MYTGVTNADCYRQAELEFEIAHAKAQCNRFGRRLVGKYKLFRTYHSVAMNDAHEVALRRYTVPLIHWRGRLLAAQNELAQIKDKRERARAMKLAETMGAVHTQATASKVGPVVEHRISGQLPLFTPDPPSAAPVPQAPARSQADIENDIAVGFEAQTQESAPTQPSAASPTHRSPAVSIERLPALFPAPPMPDLGPLPRTVGVGKNWPLILALSPLPSPPAPVSDTPMAAWPGVKWPSPFDSVAPVEVLDAVRSESRAESDEDEEETEDETEDEPDRVTDIDS